MPELKFLANMNISPLTVGDLDEFVQCYNPSNRHHRNPTWSEKNPDGRGALMSMRN